MKIVVLGLWHLGCVTAACCARHYRIIGLDSDAQTVADLQQGKAPLFEPGLNELLSAGLASGALAFTTDPQIACAGAEVLWICYDTPVNEHDESDVTGLLERVRRTLPHLPNGTLVLVSSQLPVGTCGKLEGEFPQFSFACSPENLRLGKAIEAFEKPERVIVGLRDQSRQAFLQKLFQPFTSQVLFMRIESAEMVKHALNGFLALSIAYINEIARLCERTGADAQEVSAGLKSDARIGPRSYLSPGGPFAGGTLARDVVTLTRLGTEKAEALSLIPSIKQSNDQHRGWMFGRLQARFGNLRGCTTAVLGLTYKPGTDTLRRSVAIELCRQLTAAGATVRAWDPVVHALPPDLKAIALTPELAEALQGVDAAVICTEWPQLRQARWREMISTMRQPVIIDANRFLEKELKELCGIEHLSVGRAL
ncbi:UDP-glucose 6-dehydrogenase Udg [Verrucomicrobia bacterium]|nr:UDP-glucose 6-dehydrogenase Udg [Verrucomicrobiota bacterium]